MSQQERNVAEAVHEMSKPLARYRDDADLDEKLKVIEREEDPMQDFLTKKKKKATAGKKGICNRSRLLLDYWLNFFHLISPILCP